MITEQQRVNIAWQVGKPIGKGMRAYYLMRADLARKHGNEDLARSYEMMLGALPLWQG